jgi:hypothetical protein
MIKRPQFVHFRALEEYDAAGSKLEALPQFRLSPYGGVTLHVFPFPFDETQVVVGVAVCSPLDFYDRRRGRLISEGRTTKLRQRPLRLVPNGDKFLWLRLDRVASKAWFEACAVKRLYPPPLQRGGRMKQLVGVYGTTGVHPWVTAPTPAGVYQVVPAPGGDSAEE